MTQVPEVWLDYKLVVDDDVQVDGSRRKFFGGANPTEVGFDGA